MRIAAVCTTFLPTIGGAEQVVHNLARQWVRQGHEVLVVNTTASRPVDRSAGYSVRRLPLLRGSTRIGYHRHPFSDWAAWRLGRVLQSYQPEFISAHHAYPSAFWLSLLRPVPRFIVTCHGWDITDSPWGARSRSGVDEALARALGASAGVVAISRRARGLLEEFGLPSSRILDIPNGIDFDRFQNPSAYGLRSELGIPESAVLVLSVGHDRPPKAYDRGLRAFARLVRGGTDAYYVIIGNGSEQWKDLARELGVGERFRPRPSLPGDAMPGAYQQADIFFSPSVSELFPIVLLEAMASGLPVVVTRISGHEDAIEHGQTGVLVEPDSFEEMEKALADLAADPQLRRRIGSQARDRAAHYRWERISRLYTEHA